MYSTDSGLCINVLLNLTIKFASWRVTNKVSYHRGASLSEHALLIWCFVMAHKPWDLSLSACCSMGTVSKILCSHFSHQGRYYGCTHAWTKLQNEVRSWISGAYDCHYAWTLPEANSTSVHDLMVTSVSSLPLSVLVYSRIQQKTFSFLACVQISYLFVRFKFSVYVRLYQTYPYTRLAMQSH